MDENTLWRYSQVNEGTRVCDDPKQVKKYTQNRNILMIIKENSVIIICSVCIQVQI
jgi:hypothetical protein